MLQVYDRVMPGRSDRDAFSTLGALGGPLTRSRLFRGQNARASMLSPHRYACYETSAGRIDPPRLRPPALQEPTAATAHRQLRRSRPNLGSCPALETDRVPRHAVDPERPERAISCSSRDRACCGRRRLAGAVAYDAWRERGTKSPQGRHNESSAERQLLADARANAEVLRAPA